MVTALKVKMKNNLGEIEVHKTMMAAADTKQREMTRVENISAAKRYDLSIGKSSGCK